MTSINDDEQWPRFEPWREWPEDRAPAERGRRPQTKNLRSGKISDKPEVECVTPEAKCVAPEAKTKRQSWRWFRRACVYGRGLVFKAFESFVVELLKKCMFATIIIVAGATYIWREEIQQWWSPPQPAIERGWEPDIRRES